MRVRAERSDIALWNQAGNPSSWDNSAKRNDLPATQFPGSRAPARFRPESGAPSPPGVRGYLLCNLPATGYAFAHEVDERKDAGT